MANIKSAKKRAKTNEVRHQRNMARGSDIKTFEKKVIAACGAKDISAAQTLLRQAESKIARAQGKGFFKRNTASRKISRLAKKVAVASGMKE
jgi:small subunit ribosomal protein S20